MKNLKTKLISAGLGVLSPFLVKAQDTSLYNQQNIPAEIETPSFRSVENDLGIYLDIEDYNDKEMKERLQRVALKTECLDSNDKRDQERGVIQYGDTLILKTDKNGTETFTYVNGKIISKSTKFSNSIKKSTFEYKGDTAITKKSWKNERDSFPGTFSIDSSFYKNGELIGYLKYYEGKLKEEVDCKRDSLGRLVYLIKKNYEGDSSKVYEKNIEYPTDSTIKSTNPKGEVREWKTRNIGGKKGWQMDCPCKKQPILAINTRQKILEKRV